MHEYTFLQWKFILEKFKETASGKKSPQFYKIVTVVLIACKSSWFPSEKPQYWMSRAAQQNNWNADNYSDNWSKCQMWIWCCHVLFLIPFVLATVGKYSHFNILVGYLNLTRVLVKGCASEHMQSTTSDYTCNQVIK